MLKRFNMQNAVPAKTPLPHSLRLLKATKLDRRCNQLEYTEITGSLNHLAVYSILALISHLPFLHSPSSIQIQLQRIYNPLVMSFATLSTQQITQSLTAIQILQSTDMPIQIGEEIGAIESRQLATFSSQTTEQYHGHLTGKPQ